MYCTETVWEELSELVSQKCKCITSKINFPGQHSITEEEAGLVDIEHQH